MINVATKVLLIGGLAGLAMTTAAVAADRDPAPSIVLHYSNDALATDDGVKIFYHRLLRAAEKVCPPEAANPLLVSDAVHACREQAVAAVVAKMNNSRLAALVPQSRSPAKGT
jgi:UrcA family protein